jgi:hypothetical protein
MTGVVPVHDQEERAGRRIPSWTPSRVQLGWLLCVVGVVLLVIGWYEISGLAVVAQQTPYLASASIPGAALVVAGAIVLTAEGDTRRDARLERMVTELHIALLQPLNEALESTPDEGDTAEGQPSASLVVPGGTTYHRSTCMLVVGKRDAAAVTAEEIRSRGLHPCPVCEPPAV